MEVSEPRAPWRWLRQAHGVCGIGLASRGAARGSDFPTCQATFPGAETLVGLGSREEEDGGSLHAPALSTPTTLHTRATWVPVGLDWVTDR